MGIRSNINSHLIYLHEINYISFFSALKIYNRLGTTVYKWKKKDQLTVWRQNVENTFCSIFSCYGIPLLKAWVWWCFLHVNVHCTLTHQNSERQRHGIFKLKGIIHSRREQSVTDPAADVNRSLGEFIPTPRMTFRLLGCCIISGSRLVSSVMESKYKHGSLS